MDILPWDIIGVKLEKEKKLKGTKFSSNLLISTTRDWSCIKLATSAISSSFQTVSTTARWVALNSSLLRRSTENAVVRYQSRNQGGTVVEYFVISTEFSI